MNIFIKLSIALIGLNLVLVSAGAAYRCPSRQMLRGFLIRNRACEESYACRQDIQYFTKNECNVALREFEQYPCDPSQVKRGYQIQDNNQICEEITACKSDIPFNTRQDCNAALKERKNNSCMSSQTCRNGGHCTQTSREPYFKCKCEGTGYYGQRCDSACPTAEKIAQGAKNPYECVLI